MTETITLKPADEFGWHVGQPSVGYMSPEAVAAHFRCPTACHFAFLLANPNVCAGRIAGAWDANLPERFAAYSSFAYWHRTDPDRLRALACKTCRGTKKLVTKPCNSGTAVAVPCPDCRTEKKKTQ